MQQFGWLQSICGPSGSIAATADKGMDNMRLSLTSSHHRVTAAQVGLWPAEGLATCEASEAEVSPLPSDETTPPVTNMYRAMEEYYSYFYFKNKDYF